MVVLLVPVEVIYHHLFFRIGEKGHCNQAMHKKLFPLFRLAQVHKQVAAVVFLQRHHAFGYANLSWPGEVTALNTAHPAKITHLISALIPQNVAPLFFHFSKKGESLKSSVISLWLRLLSSARRSSSFCMPMRVGGL